MSNLNPTMDLLATKIGYEIDSVIGEVGHVGDDIVSGLCHRFADDWNLYEEGGAIPDCLRSVVVGVLAKKGITEL